MSQYISLNKAKQLIEQITGSEIIRYTNGNIALVFNAIDADGPDSPMVPLTLYNKTAVNFEEAEILFKEKKSFRVMNSTFKAVDNDYSYIIYSHEEPITMYDKDLNTWSSVVSERTLETKSASRAYTAHAAKVSLWLTPEPEPVMSAEEFNNYRDTTEYTASDFGLS